MTDQLNPEELTAITADDALLDAVAAGESPDSDLGTLLTAWREELDAAVAVAAPAPFAVTTLRRPRWHRHLAGGVAAVVVLAASTGVAAAASGSSGPLAPLHNLIWGESEAHPDATVIEVTGLLNAVEQSIQAHRAGISDALRAALTTQLDRADDLIAADGHAAGLAGRADGLRSELAALPGLPVPPADDSTTSGHNHHGGTGDGSSGHGSGDGSTSGSDDGSAGTGGNDGGDDGSTSGSDDSTSGHHDGGGTDDATSRDGGSDGSGDSTDGSGTQDGSGDGSTDSGDGSTDSGDSTSGDTSGDTSDDSTSGGDSTSGDGSADSSSLDGGSDRSSTEDGGSDGAAAQPLLMPR